ncbi:MAG: nitroreductase family protein [Verrucomicrobiota bacterium]
METPAAIRTRCTLKVITDANDPWPAGDSLTKETLDELIALAGMAPFHKAADKSHRDGVRAFVPWRFYVLDAANCRALLENLQSRSIDGGKISGMLATAEALIQVTWLPNPAKDDTTEQLFDPTLENMEHIAAASSAVQNLLLAATDRGLPNYWSSGGILREPEQYDLLGIPHHEILLGSIFLFPADTRDAELHEGKLRKMREPVSDWARPVVIRS